MSWCSLKNDCLEHGENYHIFGHMSVLDAEWENRGKKTNFCVFPYIFRSSHLKAGLALVVRAWYSVGSDLVENQHQTTPLRDHDGNHDENTAMQLSYLNTDRHELGPHTTYSKAQIM